jgi:hypothetical protein
MTCIARILLAVVLSLGLLCSAVAQAGQARKPATKSPQAAGAVTVAGTVATPPSGGSGVTWGKGTLILHDGTQHAFEVSGLGVTGTQEAVVSVHAIGEVFNLKKLAQFEGTYKATQPKVRTGRGTGEVSFTNEHGVLVSLSLSSPATTPDVTLIPSPTGINVKLEK